MLPESRKHNGIGCVCYIMETPGLITNDFIIMCAAIFDIYSFSAIYVCTAQSLGNEMMHTTDKDLWIETR